MPGNRVYPEGGAPAPTSVALSPAVKVIIVVGVVSAMVVMAAVIAVAVVLTSQSSDKSENYFKCDDGVKLKASRQCDGYAECAGGEDEEDCSCGNRESSCSSDGTCIWDGWFCDGTTDCGEGEDEDDCGLSCGSSEFGCKDHSECVAVAQRCDQVEHCADGSDEWQCLSLEWLEGEEVLLALYRDSYIPVCSTDWDSSWNSDICAEMGFGDGLVDGTLASNSVNQSSDGFMEPINGGVITNSSLNVLTYSSSCSSGLVKTLTCTYDSCGSRGQNVSSSTGQERIIQGYRAEQGAWPWQAAVELVGEQICGGSVIDNYWVVAAAHCIAYSYYYYSVRAGSVKVSGNDTYLQVSDAAAVYVHEDYNSANLSNDIALIQLSTPLTYTDYVRPVCLPEVAEDWADAVACYTSGWGSWVSSATRYPDLLQDVKMPMIDATACSSLADIYDDALMICAGYPSGYISVCSGDSGGPLVCRDKRNIWTLAGVTSYVIGSENHPCSSVSVFARVTNFSTWIAETIANNS